MNIRQATWGSCDRTSRQTDTPVPVGQPDIQHCHIGVQRQDLGHRARCRAGLADHLDVRLGLQQAAHSPADDLLIVQDEHADQLCGRIAGRLAAHQARHLTFT